jgi:hypothetical protein
MCSMLAIGDSTARGAVEVVANVGLVGEGPALSLANEDEAIPETWEVAWQRWCQWPVSPQTKQNCGFLTPLGPASAFFEDWPFVPSPWDRKD